MADYIFERVPTATIKISQWRGTDGNTLTLPNINASLSNADSLVAGVQQLLSIVGMESQVSPSQISRVVNENVNFAD